MIKALLDTNIILDIALKRKKFYNDAAGIFKMIYEKKVQAFISATTINDIFYILQKESGKEKASPLRILIIRHFVIAALQTRIHQRVEVIFCSLFFILYIKNIINPF